MVAELVEFYVETLVDLGGLSKQFDNSLDRIYLNKVLDSVTMERKTEIIQLCEKKLSHGGIVEIDGCDLLEVSRAVYGRHVECEEIHQYLGLFPICVFDASSLVQAVGLRIINKRVNNFQYHIKAERP